MFSSNFTKGSAVDSTDFALAKTVLIAEDNPDLRTIFAKIFEAHGFKVDVAVDGKDTLATLAVKLPDILILDVNMPYVSGIDVLVQLRKSPAGQQIKVIVVTGNHLADQSAEIELADLYMVKPVDLQSLVILAQRLSAESVTT